MDNYWTTLYYGKDTENFALWTEADNPSYRKTSRNIVMTCAKFETEKKANEYKNLLCDMYSTVYKHQGGDLLYHERSSGFVRI